MLGGVGLYHERTRLSAGDVTETQTMLRPGVVGGVGLSVHKQQSTFSFFSELVYHHIPTDPGSSQYVRWTTGLRISFGGRPF